METPRESSPDTVAQAVQVTHAPVPAVDAAAPADALVYAPCAARPVADTPSSFVLVGSPLIARVIAGLTLAAALTLVGMAIYLKPDARGYGTHRQLGFGACGWLVVTGLPCPSCGMTTSFAHTIRGQVLRAAYAQPAGFLFALAAIFAIPLSSWTLVAGRAPRVRMPWLTPLQIFSLGLGIFLGGWGFKIVIGLMDGTLPVRSWN